MESTAGAGRRLTTCAAVGGVGTKPPWDEGAGCSPATKGLFAKVRGSEDKKWGAPETLERTTYRGGEVAGSSPKGTEGVRACHGATGAGDFGVSKTLRQLRQGFYWGQLRRYIEDFCRRC